MNNSPVVKRAIELVQHLDAKLQDPRYAEVMEVYVGKRLLFGSNVAARPNSKTSVENAVWVGRNIEPRVLELLPAALLHFPRSFMHKEKMPDELRHVLEYLRKNQDASDGPALFGISFSLYSRWTKETFGDKRVKPLTQKKVLRTYRLLPRTIANLQKGAVQNGISENEYLEKIVAQAT